MEDLKKYWWMYLVVAVVAVGLYYAQSMWLEPRISPVNDGDPLFWMAQFQKMFWVSIAAAVGVYGLWMLIGLFSGHGTFPAKFRRALWWTMLIGFSVTIGSLLMYLGTPRTEGIHWKIAGLFYILNIILVFWPLTLFLSPNDVKYAPWPAEKVK